MIKTKAEAMKEISDLGNRLYYCTDSPDGRKMRRWIEKRIRQIGKEFNVSAEAGCLALH